MSTNSDTSTEHQAWLFGHLINWGQIKQLKEKINYAWNKQGIELLSCIQWLTLAGWRGSAQLLLLLQGSFLTSCTWKSSILSSLHPLCKVTQTSYSSPWKINMHTFQSVNTKGWDYNKTTPHNETCRISCTCTQWNEHLLCLHYVKTRHTFELDLQVLLESLL